ncbi:MAG: sulfatase/phosphatase domain-containing protein [Novosphingobium sp.]
MAWYWKQTTHEGGTRVPLVIAWPGHMKGLGEVRQDFVHVSDIAPTILEASRVPLAKTVNNVPRRRWRAAALPPALRAHSMSRRSATMSIRSTI